MSVLSSQYSADPDIFSLTSGNNTRLRNCVYFCIWCIVAHFHISSTRALSCLKEHLPLQSSFSACFHYNTTTPLSCAHVVTQRADFRVWVGFCIFIWKHGLEFAWLTPLKKEREVISSFPMLLVVGMSLAGSNGKRDGGKSRLQHYQHRSTAEVCNSASSTYCCLLD